MNIRVYGALSHEGKDWTEAFRAAVDALRQAGGGVVEGVQLSNLVMEKVMCPFVFNMYYGPQDPEGRFPVINDKNPRPVEGVTMNDVVVEMDPDGTSDYPRHDGRPVK